MRNTVWLMIHRQEMWMPTVHSYCRSSHSIYVYQSNWQTRREINQKANLVTLLSIQNRVNPTAWQPQEFLFQVIHTYNALTCIINSLQGSACEAHSYSTAQEFAHLIWKAGVITVIKGERKKRQAYRQWCTNEIVSRYATDDKKYRVWCETERDKQSGVYSGFQEVVPVIYNASALYFGKRRDCLFQLFR
jgi:hypothetical protein